MKKCRCGVEYVQYTSLMTKCPKCLAKQAKERREKKERKQHRDAKERLKTRSDWMKEAQAAFNRYIRARDKCLPCVSCGNYGNDRRYLTGSKWDCGHYRSTGASPELRFNPLNAAKQCVKCNRDLSGNIVNYRIELRKRIGDENLDWLEGPHDPKKYTIDELKEIKQGFNQWARELEREMG